MFKRYFAFWKEIAIESKEGFEVILTWVLPVVAWLYYALWGSKLDEPLLEAISLIAAIVITVRAVTWLPFKKYDKLAMEFKEYKDQRKPLGVSFLPVEIRCTHHTCTVRVENLNPSTGLDGVEVRVLELEPMMPSRTPQPKPLLSSMQFFSKDTRNDQLKGGQSAHFDIFVTSREAFGIVLKFIGHIPSGIQNDFIPEAIDHESLTPSFREYALTIEVVANGLEPNKSKYRLEFSMDMEKPHFTLSRV